jgi:hypothetical protein
MLERERAHYAETGRFLSKYDLTAAFKRRGGDSVPATVGQTLAEPTSAPTAGTQTTGTSTGPSCRKHAPAGAGPVPWRPPPRACPPPSAAGPNGPGRTGRREALH